MNTNKMQCLHRWTPNISKLQTHTLQSARFGCHPCHRSCCLSSFIFAALPLDRERILLWWQSAAFASQTCMGSHVRLCRNLHKLVDLLFMRGMEVHETHKSYQTQILQNLQIIMFSVSIKLQSSRWRRGNVASRSPRKFIFLRIWP